MEIKAAKSGVEKLLQDYDVSPRDYDVTQRQVNTKSSVSCCGKYDLGRIVKKHKVKRKWNLCCHPLVSLWPLGGVLHARRDCKLRTRGKRRTTKEQRQLLL